MQVRVGRTYAGGNRDKVCEVWVQRQSVGWRRLTHSLLRGSHPNALVLRHQDTTVGVLLRSRSHSCGPAIVYVIKVIDTAVNLRKAVQLQHLLRITPDLCSERCCGLERCSEDGSRPSW